MFYEYSNVRITMRNPSCKCANEENSSDRYVPICKLMMSEKTATHLYIRWFIELFKE